MMTKLPASHRKAFSRKFLNATDSHADRQTNRHAPDRRKTILYVGHTAILGGAEIALLRLIQKLDRRRFRPLVVLSECGPLQGKLETAGIETHVLPLTRRRCANAQRWIGRGSVAARGQSVRHSGLCFSAGALHTREPC